jgi:EGF-like domain
MCTNCIYCHLGVFFSENIDIDECISAPCQNGGTCHDGVDFYSCSCAAGYSGVNCQTSEEQLAQILSFKLSLKMKSFTECEQSLQYRFPFTADVLSSDSSVRSYEASTVVISCTTKKTHCVKFQDIFGLPR